MASLEIFLVIGVSLLLSLVLSEAIERLGEPGFLGEILAGVVLGPSVAMLIAASPRPARSSSSPPSAACCSSSTSATSR